MSDAKKCDACHKLYIPNTVKDLDERPVLRRKTVSPYKKYLLGISLYNNSGDSEGYMDLCPSCAQKVEDVFSDTNVFVKEVEDPSVEEPTDPPIETEEPEDNEEETDV